MRRLAVALAGATCCFALPASGQTSAGDTAALNWSRMRGAEACPDLAELARRVSAHLKRDAFVSPTKATVLVDASIQPAEPGFRVRIVLSSSDQATPGERALTSLSPDCNEAIDSLGLNLEAGYLAPRRLTIPVQERAVGGEFSLLSGQLSGAWSPYRRAPLVLSVLAGPQFARVLARGFGFTGSNRDVGSWLVSGTVEGEATWALSERWDLLLRLGLGVPIWRDSFEASTSSGVTTILEPSPFFGTLKVALAVSP